MELYYGLTNPRIEGIYSIRISQNKLLVETNYITDNY